MYKNIIVLLSAIILWGCGGNDPKLNDDNTAEMLPGKLIRFDKELFAINPDNISTQIEPLIQKYGTFFELYCTGILGIAHPSDPVFEEQLYSFFTNDVIMEAHKKVAASFTDVSDINIELEAGFKRYSEIFNDKPIPKVYSYISGFNQALMLTDDAVGVSLDMFLGQNDSIYTDLSFPRYKQKNLYRERIPLNVITAWAIGEFYWDKMGQTLLATMIYEGKLTYLGKTMLPKTADTTLFGFRGEELQWCLDNEKYMWVELVENRLLFETSYTTVKRMTEDGPFTPNISGSPGKAPNWIGYRIVEQYMKQSSSTLPGLMADNDYRKILEVSAYNP
ncbi:MAG: hypothetical protein LBG19_12070 [Prevotellaceae bacterium]|jgi:hypothetical protein|nr:hypothetical protein [Prevotellaceae bacterium]